jgi:stearoyl-CoA desaturase (delta-9 desaturase)
MNSLDIAQMFEPERSLPPWDWPWWRATSRRFFILPWFILIHITATLGVIAFPIPGWHVAMGTLLLAWLGGLGTTVCYHRALAHRSLKLHPVVSALLTFFAVFNGSGTPLSWAASHRLHHAVADTFEDLSSPTLHGFWWAHLRWLWQAETPSTNQYAPDLNRIEYRLWRFLQPAILTLSYLAGLYFGKSAFYWLGSIRLVFSLHSQCFVNSICHMQPNIPFGLDSSRNVPWLAPVQLFLGENWHRNHHAHPAFARLGWGWRQPDLGYGAICLFEKCRLASQVRRMPTPGVFSTFALIRMRHRSSS